jgi:hypothetical protein
MPADKREAYYWDIYTLIFENDDMLALDDPDFSLSDADTASITNVSLRKPFLGDVMRRYDDEV